MTLRQLMRNMTIQGDIRFSFWIDDEEVNVLELHNVSNLKYQPGIDAWTKMEITYVFAAPDGYLHFEFGLKDA